MNKEANIFITQMEIRSKVKSIIVGLYSLIIFIIGIFLALFSKFPGSMDFGTFIDEFYLILSREILFIFF